MDNKGKEKRRRTADKESGEGRSKKIIRSRQDNKDDATEEQVEEFFAILRRMQEAVKYFEKESGEGWRAALEAEVVAVVGEGSDNEDKAEETQIEDKKPAVDVAETGVLDLNAVPEAESS